MNPKELIYFIHMPKTGGSTLTGVIKNQFSSSEILAYYHNQDEIQNKLKQVNMDDLKIIHGHYFFGIHEFIDRPFSYFTILRHPVERVISLYYYLKNIEGERYDIYREMTLDEFVENKIEDNIQTAYLSGNERKPGLLKAVRNLRRYFDVVGTIEQFDETLYLLGKRYGWTKLHYKRKNVTASRPHAIEVSEKTKRLIKQTHHKDLLLYKYAQKLLTKQLNELNEQEKAELKNFKRAQAEFERNEQK